MRYVAGIILIIFVQATIIHLFTKGEKYFEDALKGSVILAGVESILLAFIFFW